MALALEPGASASEIARSAGVHVSQLALELARPPRRKHRSCLPPMAATPRPLPDAYDQTGASKQKNAAEGAY